MNTLTDNIAQVLTEPLTSDWLRVALRAALRGGPVQAANDAERLAELLTGQVETMLFLEEWEGSRAR